MSLEVFKKLTSKGGEAELSRVMKERGWNGEDSIVIPTMIWNQQEKKIRGMSWKVRGKQVTTQFAAGDMWEGLLLNGREIRVTLNYSLDSFIFPTEGEGRASSQWLSIEVITRRKVELSNN